MRSAGVTVRSLACTDSRHNFYLYSLESLLLLWVVFCLLAVSDPVTVDMDMFPDTSLVTHTLITQPILKLTRCSFVFTSNLQEL